MQVSSISNQNFNGILIPTKLQKNLFKEILSSDEKQRVYKELIIDLFELKRDQKSFMVVGPNGEVVISSTKGNKEVIQAGGSIFDNLINALKEFRLDRPKHFLNKNTIN